MVNVGLSVLVCVGLLGSWYIVKKKKLHSRLLFRIAYYLYTKTRIGYYYHKRVIDGTKGFHTKPKIVSVEGDIAIHIIPVLSDNYCYVVVDTSTGVGVAIDPADPYTVQKALDEKGIDLRGILTTHKHWDHSGGNYVLKEKYPNLLIYGSKEDNPPSVNRYVTDGEHIKVGGMEFIARTTPGHTVGHVVYLLVSTKRHCLFSGDHLFSGGCGKVFEGTFEAMLKSLETVKAMESSTLVFPGHEYTFRNMQFALSIEPDNIALERKLDEVKSLRIRREATVPCVLSDELQFNPFLKTNSLILQNVTSTRDEVAVLKRLRELKDEFS